MRGRSRPARTSSSRCKKMSWLTQSGSTQRRLLRFFRENRAWIFIAVALCAVALTLWSFGRFVRLGRLESGSVSFRFFLRGNHPASPEIAVVGIMPSSFVPSNFPPEDVAQSEALQLISAQPSWPWNRKVFARLVERLFAEGARVVALDVVFANTNQNDSEFAAVLKKYQDRIVIAATFQQESE